LRIEDGGGRLVGANKPPSAYLKGRERGQRYAEKTSGSRPFPSDGW
jgi:hypothetical protein